MKTRVLSLILLSLNLELLIKASFSPDDKVVVNAVRNGYSELALIQDVCFRLEQEVDFCWLVALDVLIFFRGQRQGSRHVMHGRRTVQDCA